MADPSHQKPKALLWSIVTCCTIYRCWDMAQLRWVLMFHHLLAAAGLDEASGNGSPSQAVGTVGLLNPFIAFFAFD